MIRSSLFLALRFGYFNKSVERVHKTGLNNSIVSRASNRAGNILYLTVGQRSASVKLINSIVNITVEKHEIINISVLF